MRSFNLNNPDSLILDVHTAIWDSGMKWQNFLEQMIDQALALCQVYVNIMLTRNTLVSAFPSIYCKSVLAPTFVFLMVYLFFSLGIQISSFF